MTNERVIIIGAGLAGSLLAIYLAKKGIAADVYEARADMRLTGVAAGRSINLALSDRATGPNSRGVRDVTHLIWPESAFPFLLAREAERGLILQMLTRTRWNRKQAAEILGISYKALLYKIKETGLDKAS